MDGSGRERSSTRRRQRVKALRVEQFGPLVRCQALGEAKRPRVLRGALAVSAEICSMLSCLRKRSTLSASPAASA